MEYVTTDHAIFSSTTAAGHFIASATFSHKCPGCDKEETEYLDGFPITTLSRSSKHIEVRCTHCDRVYFSRITATLDLCQVYSDHGYDFAFDLANAWGLSIGALKQYHCTIA